MLDSDIKRTITIDANRREVSFLMIAPLHVFVDNHDAWELFGRVSKADMPMEIVLETMSEMIKAAKR